MIIFVDLDKTLILNDTTLFAFKKYVRSKPLVQILKLLLSGKTSLKKEITMHIDWKKENLLINSQLFMILKKFRENGDELILISGSHTSVVESIAKRSNIFLAAYGSDNKSQLKFRKKLKFIQNLIGSDQFGYIGDAWRDSYIFKHAKDPILVSNSNIKKTILKKFLKIKNLSFCGKKEVFSLPKI